MQEHKGYYNIYQKKKSNAIKDGLKLIYKLDKTHEAFKKQMFDEPTLSKQLIN